MSRTWPILHKMSFLRCIIKVFLTVPERNSSQMGREKCDRMYFSEVTKVFLQNNGNSGTKVGQSASGPIQKRDFEMYFTLTCRESIE